MLARDPDGAIGTFFCGPIGHVHVSGDYVESWLPHAMAPAALAKARGYAGRVTEELGGVGIFGVELFVKGDRVWFSEVSPRPHDAGLVTLASQWQSEFELYARALLGLPVDTATASAVIYGGVEAKDVVFEGVADALAIHGTDLRLFGKPDAYIRRRMGVALAHAPTAEQARTRAKAAAAKVRPRAP